MNEFHCPECGSHYRFPFHAWEAVMKDHASKCKETPNG